MEAGQDAHRQVPCAETGAAAPVPRRWSLRAAGGATLAAASDSRVVGANARLRVALVGCGGRGRKLVWDADREDFVNDPVASSLLGRRARRPRDPIFL
ncbi:MAG: hypothetical protein OXN97_19555 [Bryobacterales bacterium]|nr:hypothetical protein [Bryobacterales bacterium]